MPDSPGGPAGSVKVLDFRLLGQHFQAMATGPTTSSNDVSLVVLL